MGWTNTDKDELTAPSSTPFVPGNNVIGFGTQLPPELIAAGFTSAIVSYSTDWDPTSTVPKVKFRFIAPAGGSTIIGIGWCANPSVSQVATIAADFSAGLVYSGGVASNDFELFDLAGHSAWQFASDSVNRALAARDVSGVIRVQIGYDVTARAYVAIGGTSFEVPNGAAYCQVVGGPLVGDTSWQTIGMLNSWVSDSGNPAQCRMMPDGTVQFRGHVTKSSNPTNGEQWGVLPNTSYEPAHVCTFLAACGSRAYNGSQKVDVTASGECLVWDMAAASGDIMLSAVRYPVI